MPNIKNYKDKKKWMEDCLHQTLHIEKKKKDQGLAQCLNMWPQKKNKVARGFIKLKGNLFK